MGGAFLAGFVVVLIATLHTLNFEVVSSTSAAGLVITSIMTVSGLLGSGSFTLSEAAKGMGSVQRIYQYIDDHNFEADFSKPPCPIEKWPNQGQISINNVVCKYRENLP